ncbi:MULTISPECIES: cytochrome c551 [Bacillaceae]|uniref:Cytochrome c551 n=1 Tax=Peribacillus huizhouensis TaxID=1501239 RepID=A0ABR6CP01_9BACI|nr:MULTISPECIES: cytochrome c [Bacillaceae]MBA9026761.1 cytochrome c551 [Peribacillus huizhouensis]
MNKKLITLLLGTTLALAACGSNDNANKPTNEGGTTTTSAGEADQIYKNKCSSCHGANLEGAFGPELKAIGSTLSKEDIETIIKEGKGGMPAKLIKEDQAAIVAEWLSEKK